MFFYIFYSSCLRSQSRAHHWYHTTSCPMSKLLVQRKSWWKLRIPLLQPIQPTLLPPMLQRTRLLSSLLAIEPRIQRRMQPMFVRPKRRLCLHSTMDTSNHLSNAQTNAPIVDPTSAETLLTQATHTNTSLASTEQLLDASLAQED